MNRYYPGISSIAFNQVGDRLAIGVSYSFEQGPLQEYVG